MAGSYIRKILKKNSSKIFPVDSEHSAIWQCLRGEKIEDVKNIILTGSGGPFRTFKKSEFKNITKAMALNHPNWEMGRKITIDSSTMMNKGLEVIETKWLFNVSNDQIKIIVHPESVIHSMVEFKDCSIKAQLGVPDMRIPIQYALTYPSHIENGINPSLNFQKYNCLNFQDPDLEKFKCIKLAYEAMKSAESYCTVMNVANDETVYAFLSDKVSYIDIPNIIEKAMERHDPIDRLDLEKIKMLIDWTKNFIKGEIS
jgi:1-deoxy-D-xylulose-5-phosphate reductoisomerase